MAAYIRGVSKKGTALTVSQQLLLFDIIWQSSGGHLLGYYIESCRGDVLSFESAPGMMST